MFVILMFLVATVVLAVAVLAVVTVGVGGRYQDKNHRFTQFAAQAASHMNGDAQAPAKLAKLLK